MTLLFHLLVWLLGMLTILFVMPIIKRVVMGLVPLIRRWLRAELNAAKGAYIYYSLAATLKYKEIRSFWTLVWRNGYGFYASEDTS